MSGAKTVDQSDWVRDATQAHRDSLLRYAFSLCHDYSLAEDAVQETFLRLFREPREKVEDHLVPWLFSVCRSRVVDALRKGGRVVLVEDVQTVSVTTTHEPNPATMAEGNDTRAFLFDRVAELPPAQREVVRLKFQSHMNYQEIAEVTGKTVNTVGVLLHTAIQSLRRAIGSSSEIGRPGDAKI